MAAIPVKVDSRSRVYLGGIEGIEVGRTYLVERDPDGTLHWTPARLVPDWEADFIAEHPDVAQALRDHTAGRIDPSRLVRNRRSLAEGEAAEAAPSSEVTPRSKARGRDR